VFKSISNLRKLINPVKVKVFEKASLKASRALARGLYSLFNFYDYTEGIGVVRLNKLYPKKEIQILILIFSLEKISFIARANIIRRNRANFSTVSEF